MQQTREFRSARAGSAYWLVVFFASLLGSTPAWGYPAKGTRAPALDSLKLLQAPGGAKASWANLRGKVVVLEFWATWCSPCVAGLPHFNHLAESLDPAKFQFISIDDEAPDAVQRFLTRKKMAGWVGVDTFGRIFARYGVVSRPTTIIVDADGNIAAVTQADSLTTAELQAVTARKKVALKPAMEIITASGPAVPDVAHSLLAVSVSKAAPDAKMTVVKHPPTGTDFLGQTSDDLLTSVFNLFAKRYFVKGSLPEGRFDLRVNAGDVPGKGFAPVVEQAVLAALHLQMQSRTLTRPGYLLRATDATRTLLSPSASTRPTKRGYWHGTFIVMNGTMDDLAYVLGTGLETNVVNETGIAGTFDARFNAGADLASLNAVLRDTLGLELVPGGQEIPITVIEVSPAEPTAPSSP